MLGDPKYDNTIFYQIKEGYISRFDDFEKSLRSLCVFVLHCTKWIKSIYAKNLVYYLSKSKQFEKKYWEFY